MGLRWRRLIHHIEPGSSPSYGGIKRGDEGIFFRPPWKKAYCSAGPKKSVVLVVGPHREIKLEEVNPRTNSEESFAQGRITCYRHQAIGSNVVELQPIELQEVHKESGWRHAEAPLHMRFEHHDLGGI
jgi:hypothetical protein